MFETQTMVDKEGAFHFQSLRPGTYQLELERRPRSEAGVPVTSPPDTASTLLGEVKIEAGETAEWHGKAP